MYAIEICRNFSFALGFEHWHYQDHLKNVKTSVQRLLNRDDDGVVHGECISFIPYLGAMLRLVFCKFVLVFLWEYQDVLLELLLPPPTSLLHRRRRLTRYSPAATLPSLDAP